MCDRGILSPYLFAVYIDQLSKDLNRVPAGCYIGNTLVNHIIYADDICCFSPSVAYHISHDISLVSYSQRKLVLRTNQEKTVKYSHVSPLKIIAFSKNKNK